MTSPDSETNIAGPKDPRAVKWGKYCGARELAFKEQVSDFLAKTSAELAAAPVNIEPIKTPGLRGYLGRLFRR